MPPGRPSSQRALDVWMNGQRVGRWSISAQGAHSFRYDDGWIRSPLGRSLSLSLPLQAGKVWRGPRVQRWFDRLVPGSAVGRQRLQVQFATASSEPFDLLATAGGDCAGAVQFLPPGSEPAEPARVDAEPLTERELIRLLDACAGETAVAGAKRPRAVLPGARAKVALLWHGGRWCRALGSTPTTHLMRLPLGARPGGAPAISTSLENEWLCARVLQAFGFEVPASRLAAIGAHKVLVVDRVDRRWVPEPGWWARLPMESLAQALGATAPGASVAPALDLLRASDRATQDRERLFAALVVWWMLAVPDASIDRLNLLLLPAGHFVLAPLPVVMSAWPVVGRAPTPASLRRLPWTLSPDGQPASHHALTPARWRAAARRHALGEGFDAVLAGLAGWVDRAVDAVATQLPAGFPASVSGPVFDGLRRCARLLDG